MLGAHGLAAGLFTSPHLHQVEERYEVGGAQMTPLQFADAIAEIAPIVEMYEQRAGEGITYFELTTALAFAWFAERAVDVAVIETGLGGRLDASNAADAAVAVVTTIGLEHTEYLGTTIAEIAGEKLAILPAGAPLVTGRLPDDAVAVAARVAEAQGGPWIRLGTEVRIGDVEMDDGGWLVTVEGVYDTYPDVFLGLHGRHQVDNLVVAIAAVEALFGRPLDPAAVREAGASVRCPGRMEIVSRDPLVMVDGAHNAPGVDALVEALREEFAAQRWQIVFGAMTDKSIDLMLAALAPRAAGFHMVAADSERAMPSADLARLAGAAGHAPVFDAGSVATGVAAALATGEPVLVTGSIYVVGEARRALGLA
ncbi:MAG: dihydrofolate synthase [Actinobacteria bacterium]|nr:dihydrofolate synthase [Actinomycetota bacterium]